MAENIEKMRIMWEISSQKEEDKNNIC